MHHIPNDQVYTIIMLCQILGNQVYAIREVDIWRRALKGCFQLYYCFFYHNLSLLMQFSQYNLNTEGFLLNFFCFLDFNQF